MNLNKLNLLLESGINIPKNTYAARIVHHQDFDGVFSAIITFRQLIKQGMDPKNITTQWIQYGESNDEYAKKLNKSKGQMVALVDFARLPENEKIKKPEFWSDHHKADKKYGTKGGRTGASEFKSDSSHLALLHTQNLVDGKTLKIIDIIDSAGYTDLEEVLKLPKNFKEKRRLERLGIICNALLTKSGILNDNSLLEDFIKKTQPSIPSFYNNILKYVRLNDIQEEAIRELRKENPNWDMIERARKVMPTQKAKNRIQKGASFNESAIQDYEELQSLRDKKNRTEEEEKRLRELINKPIEKMRQDRLGSIEKEKSKEGSFLKRGSTLIQQNPRLQRYIWTQLNTKGLKYPFVIKRYSTFIQIAVNPEIPGSVKKNIDLGKIADDVMKNVQRKFENKYNSWAFEIINKERGGHKGITNIPALGTLGLMKKADREELKYLESLEKRVKTLKRSQEIDDEDKKEIEKAEKMLDDPSTSEIDKDFYKKLIKHLSSPMRKIMPNKLDRLIELKDKKSYFSKKRTEIMNEIIEEFISQFEKRFKPEDIKMPKGKKEYEFESIINRIKEEI